MKHYFLSLIVICVFCLNTSDVLADDTHTVSAFINDLKQSKPTVTDASRSADPKIKTYPNPIERNGLLTIEMPDDGGNVTVFLYNTVGKVVRTFQITDQKTEFNVPDVSGIYLLRFVEKQKVIAVEKIVVRE